MRNLKLRIEFAVNHFKKDESWWNYVIFLDESKFNLFGSDGNGLAQTQYRAKISKVKTNIKALRETCYRVWLHFVQKHGKLSIYRRNNEPTFIFENIKGQFEAIC